MVLSGRPHQINVIRCLTGEEGFSIDISGIYQGLLRKKLLLL
jgi:hypothetical protein